LGGPLHRPGRDPQVGQFGQIARRALIGNAVYASMDDFLLHASPEVPMVNAQCSVLAERTPFDSGGNSRRIVSSRDLLAWS
jgi:hypothetical protein